MKTTAIATQTGDTTWPAREKEISTAGIRASKCALAMLEVLSKSQWRSSWAVTGTVRKGHDPDSRLVEGVGLLGLNSKTRFLVKRR